MKREDRRAVVEALIHEIEEEDIGISLFTTFYQNQSELSFFTPEDRQRIIEILETYCQDSQRHKSILERLIHYLGEPDCER